MTTKNRFRNKYRMEVREDYHLPMHAHLSGGDIDVVISLETLSVVQGNAPKSLMDEVLEWMRQHQDVLIEEWKRWHD